MGPRLLRLLHAEAARRWGREAAHRELHRCAAVWFGADHLSDLSESQGYLLLRGIQGKRRVEPSPKRQRLLDDLQAVVASGPSDLWDRLMGIARERFGAESLEDCGIRRLGALLRAARYYLSKGADSGRLPQTPEAAQADR